MLNKEAIQELSQARAIESAMSTIEAALGQHAIHGVASLPDSFKVHDLEQYLHTRRRLRGVMNTASISDFARYTESNAEVGAAVFVDAKSMKAVAVLNLGNPELPGHADNTATLTCQTTAAYQELTRITGGNQLKQKTVAEYMEDWAPNIVCMNDAGAEIATKHAIAAIRKLTIEGTKRLESADQQLSASRSTFEEVKATGADNIPARIVVTCEPYKDLSERSFTLRLGIVPGEKEIGLVLRIVKLEQHQEEMAEELAGLVRETLQNGDISVLLGTYSAKV